MNAQHVSRSNTHSKIWTTPKPCLRASGLGQGEQGPAPSHMRGGHKRQRPMTCQGCLCISVQCQCGIKVRMNKQPTALHEPSQLLSAPNQACYARTKCNYARIGLAMRLARCGSGATGMAPQQLHTMAATPFCRGHSEHSKRRPHGLR